MKPRVLYVVSRFPKLTETFVMNELAALNPRFDVRFAALNRTSESPRDEQSAAVLRSAWFVSALAPNTFLAHLRWLRRAPRGYLGVWRGAVREMPRAGFGELVKTIVAIHLAARLAELAVDARIEHVHAHFANHPATAAWVVHRLTGIPFSFTAHANDLYRASPLLTGAATEARFVVAISEYNRHLLRARCPDARVHVVHCGVDTARFSPPTERAARPRRRIVCVARFEPNKGHRDLLAGFALLATTHSEVDLVLIGDGSEQAAIQRLAASLGLGDRVAFLGACSPDEVRDQLRTAELFVLAAVRDETGRMDGIPVALMESMASGVPVVTTSVSGIPELVGDDAGLLVEPGDPAALSKAMTRILEDADLARRLAVQARSRVERGFDLYAEAAKLGDLFDASVGRDG
jgi:colanic acid/amylovoran biosynthesis glycosyltransferase